MNDPLVIKSLVTVIIKALITITNHPGINLKNYNIFYIPPLFLSYSFINSM